MELPPRQDAAARERARIDTLSLWTLKWMTAFKNGVEAE